MAVSRHIQCAHSHSFSSITLLKCIALCIMLVVAVQCGETTASSHQPRILVVLDDAAMKSSHSIIFEYLDSNFDVTYKLQKGSLSDKKKDDELFLRFFDQPETPWLNSKSGLQIDDILGRTNDDFYYDHLMLLTPSVNNFRSLDLSVEELLKFFDSGRNIFIGLDENTKTFGRDFTRKFGARLFPQKAKVHGGDKKSSKNPANVSSKDLSWSDNIHQPIKKTIVDIDASVAFKGTGMKLDKANSYAFPILKGVNDMYANNPDSKDGQKSLKTSGPDITLVAGYQSRYNQRVVMSGSVDMCNDDFISSTTKKNDHKNSPNYQFCMNILKWNFQQKSVLKIENFSHSLVDTSLVESGRQKEQEYKLKDEIQVSVDIYEKVGGVWVPFRATDVKLQFIMLNPYVTTTLDNNDGARFSTKFNVPDHNGVYKFKLDYQKPGYTWIDYEEIAPVRVLNHDEFPQYEPSGYPYYAAVISVVIATVLFTVSFATTSASKVHAKVKKD